MDDFWKQFNSIPLVQKILLFGIVVFSIFLGFWFLLYQPLWGRVTDTRDEFRKAVEERQRLKQLKKSKKKVLDKVEELQAKIVIAEDKLPSSAQLPRLLKLIHEKAKTAGLEIENFQRLEDRPQEYYVEIPVEMKLEGTYGELTSFLKFVNRMNRIVSFHDLSLQRKQEGKGELVVSTMATTYRYQEEQSGEKKSQ
jgi:type IV pilus assembly protein PilO